MANRMVADAAGLFTIEVQVSGTVLRAALDHARADDLLHCAVITALSALAQEDPWPERALDALAAFMVSMRDQLMAERLC
jgi:divalent metal cation (Fe/Co/Zn/Cd) transporter